MLIFPSFDGACDNYISLNLFHLSPVSLIITGAGKLIVRVFGAALR
jgi:hypothetical protein